MSNNDLSMIIRNEYAQKQQAQQKREAATRIFPVVIMVALFVIFSILQPSFLSATNIRSLLNQLAIPMILAMGITFVILMGSIDLSIDGTMGMAAAFVALFALSDIMIVNLGVFGLILPVIFCGAIGYLNGLIHVKCKIPTFMVTFAMSSIAGGIGLLSYKGVPGNIKFQLLKTISTGDIGGFVPYIFIISIAVFFILFILQRWTSFGRYLFAIGDNESIAQQSGINVDKIKMIAFAVSGCCIGLAGVLGAGKIARGTVAVGTDQLFPALTAVVLGGTSLSGGKGGVVNTLMGAITVTVLQNGLIMLGVDSTVQKAIQGVIILAAVALTTFSNVKQVTK